jgi:hypothetical protein
MAGFSIVPDVIRYGRNRNSANPMHGMMSGGIRGMLSLGEVIERLPFRPAPALPPRGRP